MNNTHTPPLETLHMRPISVYPIYKILTGSYNSAVLFSQIMYGFNYFNKDEYFKTDNELKKETLLTDNEFRKSKNDLKKNCRFLNITIREVPAKTFYIINWGMYDEVLKIIAQRIN